MERRKFVGLIGAAAAAAFAPGLTACYGPPPYGRPQPVPPRYEYYYYPQADVYFHIYTGWYYYRSDGIWWRSRHLPLNIRLSPRYRRLVVVKEAPPYRRYPQHRESYPPPRNWRPDPRRDREEREHNRRVHQEYLRRWPNR